MRCGALLIRQDICSSAVSTVLGHLPSQLLISITASVHAAAGHCCSCCGCMLLAAVGCTCSCCGWQLLLLLLAAAGAGIGSKLCRTLLFRISALLLLTLSLDLCRGS
jgi:hypothetical protein